MPYRYIKVTWYQISYIFVKYKKCSIHFSNKILYKLVFKWIIVISEFVWTKNHWNLENFPKETESTLRLRYSNVILVKFFLSHSKSSSCSSSWSWCAISHTQVTVISSRGSSLLEFLDDDDRLIERMTKEKYYEINFVSFPSKQRRYKMALNLTILWKGHKILKLSVKSRKRCVKRYTWGDTSLYQCEK